MESLTLAKIKITATEKQDAGFKFHTDVQLDPMLEEEPKALVVVIQSLQKLLIQLEAMIEKSE